MTGKSLLEEGDLLICEGGEVGRMAIWGSDGQEVFFQKALHRMRLDRNRASPTYVQQFMWFMAENGGFKDFTTSATIAHLTGVKLKKFNVHFRPRTPNPIRIHCRIDRATETRQVSSC